jgi:dienelactone hydrolase
MIAMAGVRLWWQENGMLRGLQFLLFLAFLALPRSVSAADFVIDGVPLPPDAHVAATSGGAFESWKHVWVGLWRDSLKHILLVESVSADGAARVVYANGNDPRAGRRGRWRRLEGVVSGHTLSVTGEDFITVYEMADDGGLKARFELGSITSSAAMIRTDVASVTKAEAVIAWTRGNYESLQTDLIEDGKPVRLETVIFRPQGAGPFPLAVINHGSTGRGLKPELVHETWFSTDLANFLNDRGWIVAFPQRRGRGKSDGQYDEGWHRQLGYACAVEISLRGADRALTDIDAAIAALRRRPDVAPVPVLIGGQSRGGVLSIAYAGLHPNQVAGAINFVGGWLGEGCSAATAVNHSLVERGAAYARPTLWLYGQHDSFYSMAHSRDNFAAFEKAGGHGKIFELEAPAGQGHFIFRRPDLWSEPVDSYLKSLAVPQGH